MAKKIIAIDVERMKYKNIGLYTFCAELVKALQLNNLFHFKFYGTVEFSNLKPTWYHKLIGVFFKDIDLWHATHQDTNYLPLTKTPIVLTIHDLNFLYTDKSVAKKRKRLKRLQTIISKSSYIAVISKYVLKDVKKHLDLTNKPLKVIYNGTTIDTKKDVSNLQIKARNFIFFIGTVVPKKNVHVLLNLLLSTDHDLIIAGVHSDKNYFEKINHLAKELGVFDRLKLIGPISEEEKIWYYKNCEAFAFPSLSEGFGLPVIEAMRFGKPVFCSNLTSLPEVGGKECYYFNSFEASAMQKVFSEGMQDYKRDPSKKDSIKQWSEKFRWENTAKAYEKVYQEVLGV